jgi:hypothetical protein
LPTLVSRPDGSPAFTGRIADGGTSTDPLVSLATGTSAQGEKHTGNRTVG